jgi:hypothetical protein
MPTNGREDVMLDNNLKVKGWLVQLAGVIALLVGIFLFMLYIDTAPLLSAAAGLIGIIAFIVLAYRGSHLIKKSGKGDTGAADRTNIRRSAIIAAMLLMADSSVVTSGGLIAVMTLVIAIPVLLFKAIRWRADKDVLKRRLIVAGIYGLMAILSLSINALNNTYAEKRMMKLAAVCELYKEKYGGYPDALSQLTPEFMESIPPAKYLFPVPTGFRYGASANSHTISYLKISPYGIGYYNLEEKRLGELD